jgi:hypothetical protein
MRTGNGLADILRDRDLARFGDSYVNFAFSLAATRADGIPRGTKVTDRNLAEAAKRSGIRERLPKRTKRADSANAVEALLGHAYLKGLLTLEATVDALSRNLSNPSEALTDLAVFTMGLIEKSQ